MIMKRKNIIFFSILILLIIAILFLTINNRNIIKIAKNDDVKQGISDSNQLARETIKEDVHIENDKKDVILDIDIDSDYIMPENLTKSTPYIIIGRIKSIDGGINYNAVQNVYTVPQTIGSVEVIKVLKGDISEKTIPFVRRGGMVTFENYEKGLVESQKTKLALVKLLSEQEKKTKYVSMYESEDIKPEEGKEYLMYLCYDEDYDRYNIDYFQYGLREIKNVYSNKNITLEERYDELKVKNNITGEYENISDIVKSSDI